MMEQQPPLEEAASTLDDSSLPDGWIEVDDETGHYYYDTITQATVAERPTAPAGSTPDHFTKAQPEVSMEEKGNDPVTTNEPKDSMSLPVDTGVLPAGWEAVTDATGRVYFWHAASQTTQWERPSEESPADDNDDELASDAVLPEPVVAEIELEPGWQALEDDQGRTYFFHAASQTTQWERPSQLGHETPLPDAATVESWPADDEATTTAGADEVTATETLVVDQLEDGWEAVEDSEGRTYYFHPDSGATQWEKPIKEATVSSEPAETELTATAAAQVGSGEECKGEDELGPGDEEELEAGWKSVVDADGRTYYYRADSGMTEWERPVKCVISDHPTAAVTLDASAGDISPPGGVEEDASANGSVEEPSEKPTGPNATGSVSGMDAPNEGDEGLGTAFGDDGADFSAESTSPASRDTDLADGWEAVTDSDGRVYYYHAGSGRTQWDIPTGPAVAEMQQDTTSTTFEPENVAGESPLIASASVDSDAVEPATKALHDKEVAVTGHWQEVMDDAGRTYYFHAESGETRWDWPETELDIAMDLNAACLQTVPSDGAKPTNDEQLSAMPEDVSNEVKETEDGWEAVEDPATGRIYYFHSESNTTSWERRTVQSKEAHSMIPNAARALQEPGSETSTTTVEPPQVDESLPGSEERVSHDKSRLPDGWEKLVDESSGLSYFYHSASNQTSWDHPSERRESFVGADETPAEEEIVDSTVQLASVDSKELDLASSRSNEDMPELPDGWQEIFDPTTGKSYYYNEGDDATVWERPTRQVQASEATESVWGTEATGGDESDASSSSSSEPETKDENQTPLPKGWIAIAQPEAGSVYYYNTGTNETSWDRPELESPGNEIAAVESLRTASIDAEDAPVSSNLPVDQQPLPPGWEEISDPDSSVSYFFHAATQTTQWERPLIPDETRGKSEPTVAADGEVEDPFNRPVAAATEVLVDGWEALEDDEGATYYYHAESGTAQWDRPIQQVRNLAALPEHTEGQPEISSPSLSSWKESPEDTAVGYDDAMASNEDGEEAPELQVEDETTLTDERATGLSQETDLPEGWVELLDEATGEYFYYCEVEDRCEWERPTKLSVVVLPDKAIDKSHLDKSEDVKKRLEDKASPESAPEETTTAPTTGATLPDGWTEMIDPASGEPYFVDKDGMTSWERPIDSSIHVDGVDVPESALTQMGESDAHETGRPADWETLVDPDSGETYYYNQMEDIASWERPKELTDRDSPHAAEERIETSAYAGDSDTGNNDDVDLRTGWTTAIDPDSGETYYVNKTDGSTRWERPSGSQCGANFTSVKSKLTEAENSARLLGWHEVIDPGSGEIYYCNESTGETSWDRPTESVIENHFVEDSTEEVEHAAVGDQGLVGEWEEVLDVTTGTLYFFNSVTGVTQWDRPIPAAPAKRTSLIGRPGHAIASFGFGGRLCTWLHKPGIVNHVLLQRTLPLVKSEPIIEIEATKIECGCSGPLLSSDDGAVLAYIDKRASIDVLWRLVAIASQSRGRLRSDSAVGDPASPESAVVKVLLEASDRGAGDKPALTATVRKGSLGDVQALVVDGKIAEASKLAAEEGYYDMALVLASMCGQSAYQSLVAQFACDNLRLGSPLYTVTALFSTLVKPPSRGETSTFWGATPVDIRSHWKEHLAAIINNRAKGWDRFGVSLGDHLMSVGEVEAAHFCYVFCGCPVASLARPDVRLTLLGSHVAPCDVTLGSQHVLASFERTEAYEWAKRRGNPSASILSLQPFKLMYAMRLVDYGLEDAARKYVNIIVSVLGEAGDGSSEAPSGPLSLALISADRKSVLAALAEFNGRLERRLSTDEAISHTLQSDMDADSSFLSALCHRVEPAGETTTLSARDVAVIEHSGPGSVLSSSQHDVGPSRAMCSPPLQPPLHAIVEEKPEQRPSMASNVPLGRPPTGSSPPAKTPTRPATVSAPAPSQTEATPQYRGSSVTTPHQPPVSASEKTSVVKPKTAPMSAPANLEPGSSGKSK